jgi:hypothetical protein
LHLPKKSPAASPAVANGDVTKLPAVEIAANEYWTGPCDAARRPVAIVPAGQPLPVQELAPKVYETLVAHWNLPGRESVIAYHGSTRR